jgi:hypothetical protein
MVTRTVLTLTIFAFYTTIIVMLGLANIATIDSGFTGEDPPDDPGISNVGDFIDFFVGGLTFAIDAFPAWLNTLLFLPLIITLGFIIVTLILDLIPG